MDRIQRNGETWQRQPSGEWLRFDVASGQWLATSGPPPPPPPPPAASFGGDTYVPLETSRRRQASLSGLRDSLAGLDRRIALVGGAALLAVLLLAGGFVAFGGNEPGVALVAAPTGVAIPQQEMSKRKQFIHDADQICAGLMTKFNTLPTPTTLEEVVAAMGTVRTIVMDARSVGQKLNVPKDARKGWTSMMGTDADIAEFDAVIASLKQGDVTAFQAWEQENKGNGARDRKWAKRYGMKVCSQELG